MKLSKALLGAIVVGVATQATTSCDKKDAPTPKKTSTLSTLMSKKTTTPDNCPGCGLG